jgi:hypothetical protein
VKQGNFDLNDNLISNSSRWSSTAMMMRKAVKFRHVVAHMKSLANAELSDVIPAFTTADWDLIIKLNNMLEPTIMSIKVLLLF